jgi:hypothetical protein
MRTVMSLSVQGVVSSEYQDMLQGALKQAQMMSLLSFFFLAFADLFRLVAMLWHSGESPRLLFPFSFTQKFDCLRIPRISGLHSDNPTYRYGSTLVASREYDLTQFFTIFGATLFGTQATVRLFGFAYSKISEPCNSQQCAAYFMIGFTRGKLAANHVLGWRIKKDHQQTSLTVDTPLSSLTADTKGLGGSVAVAFNNVYFSYPTRERAVLKGIDFEVGLDLYATQSCLCPVARRKELTICNRIGQKRPARRICGRVR